ncbi:MAG: transcription factor WhiB [Streptomyces sp.]|nr:transcription factor WhiB [Streptomyces sp.]
MRGPWQGGLHIRGLDLGETPVADFLCGACLDHKRVTGRRKVAEFLRDNPVTAHGPNCRPKTT